MLGSQNTVHTSDLDGFDVALQKKTELLYVIIWTE